MVATVFTQVTTGIVLDQLPTPSSGQIGLGSLTGTIGAVRTAQAKSDAIVMRSRLDTSSHWTLALLPPLLISSFFH